MKNNITYTYKGITYEILTKEGKQRDNQILIDFLHCEKTHDWMTIKNRITNGVMWGWLREKSEVETNKQNNDTTKSNNTRRDTTRVHR